MDKSDAYQRVARLMLKLKRSSSKDFSDDYISHTTLKKHQPKTHAGEPEKLLNFFLA